MRQRGKPTEIQNKKRVDVLRWLCAWLCLLGTAAAAMTGGCDRKRAKPSDLELLRVVATIYPLADIARRVGGTQVDVRWFIEGGQSLSDAPSSTTAAAAAGPLQVADLVVARGTADDGWALAGADNPASAARYVRVDLLESALGRDGYLWLDPQVARELADKIRQRLTEQRPEYEDYFRDNEQALVRDIDALVEQYKPGPSPTTAEAQQHRQAMFSTDDFRPLADAIGVELIFVPLETNERQRAMEFDDIRKRAEAEKITTLFIPADRTAAYQRDLSARTGLEVRTLDPVGSSAPAAGRSTYLDLMRYNFESLEGSGH